MPNKMKIKCRVENYYIDTGSEIVTWPEAEIDEPPFSIVGLAFPPDGADGEAMEAWLQEELFGLTGTGRTKGDATYDLEVVESSRPDLVPIGWTYEWGY